MSNVKVIGLGAGRRNALAAFLLLVAWRVSPWIVVLLSVGGAVTLSLG